MPEIGASHVAADDLAFRKPAGGSAGHCRTRHLGEGLTQDVVSVGIYELHRQRQHSDQQQVALAQDELETTFPTQGLLCLELAACVWGSLFFTGLNQIGQRQTNQQNPGRNQHHLELPQPSDQHRGNRRARHGTQRPSEAYDGEEPLSLVGRVEVIGEGPELGDHHEIKNAYPEEERHAQHSRRHSSLAEEKEHHEIRDKEQGHPIDQLEPIHLAGEDSVQRNDKNEKSGQDGAYIRLDFGPCQRAASWQADTGRQQQRLAQRPDDVIGSQDKKPVAGQQQCGHRLAGIHLRRQAYKPVQPAFLPPRSNHRSRGHIVLAKLYVLSRYESVKSA